MSFTAGSKFFVGINLGWFEQAYGYDLGYSEFDDFPLWAYPSTAPITLNLAVPNIPPNPPFISQHPEAIEQYFSKIDGVDVVRLWLFEQLEGLVFTKDGNNNLSGLDPVFINNLLAVLDSANNHNIKVYLTLFNSWDTHNLPPPGLDPSRVGKYQELFSARKQIILKIIQDPNDFCNKIIIPLVNAIKNKPAVFAIDIMNEPESVTESNLVSPPQLKNFIASVATAVNTSGIQVSVGCMRKNIATSFSSTTVDFSDIHAYNSSAIPNSQAQLDPYNSSDSSGKSCILGECGYNPDSSPYDINQEVIVLQNFLQIANDKGYAGAIAWRYTDYKNPTAVLQTVLNFANTKPTIKATKNQGCFIATAAMDSEIHPHVQFLREYRDNILLRSSHKEQFEKLLDWYYKFSPPIAEAMNKDKNLKKVMKYVVVYPIVLSLKILLKLLGNELKDF